jgi:hypothetical protein
MCFLIYMVYVHVILSLHRLPLFFYLIWRHLYLVEMQIVARHMCVTWYYMMIVLVLCSLVGWSRWSGGVGCLLAVA